MVPLVGTGVLKVRDVYPFTLGANIGTCITALLAATAVSGEFAVFALQIALVHLTFNVLATLFIFGIPFLRELPIKGAEFISEMAIKNKAVVAGYLLAVFIFTATAVSGEFAVFALQIALVHLTFNILATLFIFGIPFLREIPVKGLLSRTKPLWVAT